jgi:hypothetical protein
LRVAAHGIIVQAVPLKIIQILAWRNRLACHFGIICFLQVLFGAISIKRSNSNAYLSPWRYSTHGYRFAEQSPSMISPSKRRRCRPPSGSNIQVVGFPCDQIDFGLPSRTKHTWNTSAWWTEGWFRCWNPVIFISNTTFSPESCIRREVRPAPHPPNNHRWAGAVLRSS